jgi:hypothetical protein
MLSVSSILSDARGGESLHFSSGVFCPERFMSPLMMAAVVMTSGVRGKDKTIWEGVSGDR